MSTHTFKLPDLGEGTVSAEIVAWHVKPGDMLREDQPLVEMSTDKAVVEVPSPVSGRVISISGKPGDVIAVGATLATFDTGANGAGTAADAVVVAPPANARSEPASPVRASPATRRRAQEAGIDLGALAGSGPGGRIQPEDLNTRVSASAMPQVVDERTEEIPVIGIRRVIAQRMSEAARTIPHFSYVEEVDVTQLHALREHLNARAPAPGATLSYLPFIVTALLRALQRFPQCNAHYDAARETLLRHRAVHVGIATQTAEGLKVPVVRNAQRLTLNTLASEISRVTAAARDRSARREELGGSTITVTSLGKLGGIASTPIINLPEVAIIGVNRAVLRPMIVDGVVQVRLMMNLSSSFDHRFVDGADAAGLIQAIREMLEQPATLFMPGA
jgi:2-oxoisovalerate dehydrogenase E2 component (dihydrolipoyl transacylase)